MKIRSGLTSDPIFTSVFITGVLPACVGLLCLLLAVCCSSRVATPACCSSRVATPDAVSTATAATVTTTVPECKILLSKAAIYVGDHIYYSFMSQDRYFVQVGKVDFDGMAPGQRFCADGWLTDTQYKEQKWRDIPDNQ